MAKSVKWLFIAGGGQCQCSFHVKIEVEYSYDPFHLFRKTKNVICAKDTNFRFLRF